MKTLTEALADLLPLQLVLIIITTLFLKEISYIFTLPTLAALGVAMFEQNNMSRLIISTIAAFGIMLLYVPVCWLIYIYAAISTARYSIECNTYFIYCSIFRS